MSCERSIVCLRETKFEHEDAAKQHNACCWKKRNIETADESRDDTLDPEDSVNPYVDSQVFITSSVADELSPTRGNSKLDS